MASDYLLAALQLPASISYPSNPRTWCVQYLLLALALTSSCPLLSLHTPRMTRYVTNPRHISQRHVPREEGPPTTDARRGGLRLHGSAFLAWQTVRNMLQYQPRSSVFFSGQADTPWS